MLTEVEILLSWTETEYFSKILTENEIFEILKQSRIFVESIDRNRDFRNFEPTSQLFLICWPKSSFLKFWAEIEFFSKILTESEVFQILNWNRILFRKCWSKSIFSKFLTEIEIISKILTENEIFKILNRNRIFF